MIRNKLYIDTWFKNTELSTCYISWLRNNHGILKVGYNQECWWNQQAHLVVAKSMKQTNHSQDHEINYAAEWKTKSWISTWKITSPNQAGKMKILWDLSKLREKKSKPCGQNGTDHPGVSPPYVTGAIIHCCGISSRKFHASLLSFITAKILADFHATI